MGLSSGRFDDAPQWYWACENGLSREARGIPGERFVVSRGQRELWLRVRAEIEASEHCAWMPFGKKGDAPTLADCLHVFFQARETYGQNLNRVVLELARVSAFATFLQNAPADLCNYISNPLSEEPLKREAYDPAVLRQLELRVAATLDLVHG